MGIFGWRRLGAKLVWYLASHCFASMVKQADSSRWYPSEGSSWYCNKAAWCWLVIKYFLSLLIPISIPVFVLLWFYLCWSLSLHLTAKSAYRKLGIAEKRLTDARGQLRHLESIGITIQYISEQWDRQKTCQSELMDSNNTLEKLRVRLGQLIDIEEEFREQQWVCFNQILLQILGVLIVFTHTSLNRPVVYWSLFICFALSCSIKWRTC